MQIQDREPTLLPQDLGDHTQSRYPRAALVFGLLATAACIPYEGPNGNNASCLFTITGDSNSGLGVEAFRDMENGLLDSDHSATFRATNGATVGDMIDDLREQVENPAGRPDVAFVALGANNGLQHDPTGVEDLMAMAEILDNVPHVYFVQSNRQTEQHYHGHTTFVDEINQAMEDVAATRPEQFHVIEAFANYDWSQEMGPGGPETPGPHYFSGFSTEYPGYPEGIWIGDGIHVSPEGIQQYINWYIEALNQSCPEGTSFKIASVGRTEASITKGQLESRIPKPVTKTEEKLLNRQDRRKAAKT